MPATRPRFRSAAPVLPALAALLVSCGDSSSPRVPAAVAVAAGGNQTLAAGVVADPLQVRVTDSGGDPMSGETVTWAIASGTATLGAATSTTDASGLASTTVQLPSAPGAVTVSATVRQLTPATFTLTVTPGEARSIATVGGNNQTGLVGTPLTQPLVAEARDAFGNAVPGVVVEFTAAQGSVTPQATTDAQGRASTPWTLGVTPGVQTTVATLPSFQAASATFQATAEAGPAETLAKVSGDAQQAPPGEALRNPLVVEVLDPFDNPVPGVAVSFATPHGGSFAPAQATTAANGQASSAWTLGGEGNPEDQTATATVEGLDPVTFTAVARDPCADILDYAVGETVEGELTENDCQPFLDLSDVTFYDFYRVTLPDPGRYEFTVASDDFQPFGWAFRANGLQAAQAAGIAGEEPATVNVLSPAQDLILAANSADPDVSETGAYVLESQMLPDETTGCILIWIVGSIQSEQSLAEGDCGTPDDAPFDEYWFVLREGERLTASLGASGFTPLILAAGLSAGQFQVIEADTGTAGGAPATLDFVAVATTYHIIQVASEEGTTGPYDLTVTIAAATAASQGGADAAAGRPPFRLVPGRSLELPALPTRRRITTPR